MGHVLPGPTACSQCVAVHEPPSVTLRIQLRLRARHTMWISIALAQHPASCNHSLTCAATHHGIDLSNSAFLLSQATAQYLINLNVWTHNLLVLLARRKLVSRRKTSAALRHAHEASNGNGTTADHDHDHAHGPAADGAAVNVGDNINNEDAGHEEGYEEHLHHPDVPRCSTDHCKWLWAGWSCFVVLYSYLISISLPFFSTLVRPCNPEPLVY